MSALVHALTKAGFGAPEVRALRGRLTSSVVKYRVNLVDAIVVPAVQGKFRTLDFDYRNHIHHITFTQPKVSALCYNLTFDKSPSVRRKLAEILAEYASEEWMPCLSWLSRDRNREIQNIAYKGLDSLEGEFAAVM